MHTSEQSCATTLSCNKAWVPNRILISPQANWAITASFSSRGVCPMRVDQGTLQASRIGPNEIPYWETRTSVGPISIAWWPLRAAHTSANAATTVLPVPTSPSRRWFIGYPSAIFARISPTAASWSSVRLKGKQALTRFISPSERTCRNGACCSARFRSRSTNSSSR